MPEIKYILDESDFLLLQLYSASKDEAIKKQRRKEGYRLAGLSVICGLVLLFDDFYTTYAYYMLGAGVLLFFVYPMWSAWYYKRMFKKQVSTHYKDRFPAESIINVDDEKLEIINQNGAYNFHPSEIRSITETKDYFYIRINEFICPIPKSKVDKDIVYHQLMYYHKTFDVSYIEDINWRWK